MKKIVDRFKNRVYIKHKYRNQQVKLIKMNIKINFRIGFDFKFYI